MMFKKDFSTNCFYASLSSKLGWPDSSGITGRNEMESLAGFAWNHWPVCRGIGGRNGLEYSGKGNIDSIVTRSQEEVAQYRYNAFGKLMNQSGDFEQPFGFSTKRYDSGLGFCYYGYRLYVPAMECWLNRDPLGETGGMNLYAYVENDPVNWVDPDGKNPIVIVGIVGLAGGTAQGITTAFLPNSNFDDVMNAFGSGFLMGAAATAGAGLGPLSGILFGIGT